MIILQKLLRKATLDQRLARRIKIIVEASKRGSTIKQVSQIIHQSWHTVKKWVKRWQQARNRLNRLRKGKPSPHLVAKRVSKTVLQILQDAPRSGRSVLFTVEQFTQIIALACEPPSQSKRPISHWTARELANESEKRRIVSSISPRTVNRLLKEVDLKPHRIRYWLNTRPKDPKEFKQRIQVICDLYQQASKWYAKQIRVVSVDEKTGIQALERTYPVLPMRPTKPEAREFNYKRHGTLNLLATLEIATGQLLAPVLCPTRTEKDFLAYIRQLVETYPQGEWIIVLDHLNTHQSESLVRWIAQVCQVEGDLGVKGKSGVLKSMKTRRAFLEDRSHRIRFAFTPVHTSWLNQIEIWFSILVRKLLARESFASLKILRERILAFIDYYNHTMGKPFRWTYTGRPLTI
jgi:transposase